MLKALVLILVTISLDTAHAAPSIESRQSTCGSYISRNVIEPGNAIQEVYAIGEATKVRALTSLFWHASKPFEMQRLERFGTI